MIKTINKVMRIFFTYLIIFFSILTQVQADSFNDYFSEDTLLGYTEFTYASTLCPSNMIHYWTLNETSGAATFFDSYLGTTNATCDTDCPAPATGILDGAQQFDGIDDEVNVADDGTFDWDADASFSIEYWIKKDSVCSGSEPNDNEVIVGRDDGLLHWWSGIDCINGGKAIFVLTDNDAIGADNAWVGGTTVLTDGAWYHIVAVRDASAGKISIYVNGAEENSVPASFSAGFGSSVDINIGYLNLSDGFHYHGTLDEIALYDRALELSEIQLHYNEGNGAFYCTECQTDADCDEGNDCTDNSCAGGLCVNQCNATDYNDPCCSDPACATAPACATSRVSGAVVLYGFAEGTDTTVNDVSGHGTPLNLTIADESATSWIPGGGLSIDAPTLITSGVPATKVIDAVKTSNEITIETWIAPANISQDGPARIVTLSNDTSNRNFTLAQGLWDTSPSDLFDVRMRTTTTSDNAIPSLTTPSGLLTTDLIHVVYTRNASGVAKIHINSTEVKSGAVNGDCSNWDASYLLALGNEITEDRPWRGELHLVAIYSQALSQLEIEQNYLIGITETICDDGIDNDGDGKIDCIDSDCDELTCNDGFYCTVDDTCTVGECVGTVRDCDDGEFCNGVEYCDEDNDRCEYSGNPCPWLCNEEEDLCLIPSPPPQYCEMVISPSVDTAKSGESVEFTAVTACNDVEVAGNYEWEVTSTIGSSIDETTGLYTAGENAGTDIIKVNDTLHYYISATTIVDVRPEDPPLPAVCDLSIDPSTATIDSEGTIIFTATIPEGEGCLEPDYTWEIDTDIHSKITPGTSTCFYQAGSNKTGILFTDTITVTDNSNGTSTKATVTILYGKILGVFPKVLFTSRWITLPQIMFIIGENTRFNCTSYVTCMPNDSIGVIGQIGLGNIMLAFVLVPPNTEERFVDISVTTTNGKGEDVPFTKSNAFRVKHLSSTLD